MFYLGLASSRLRRFLKYSDFPDYLKDGPEPISISYFI